jgi:hypothetical protein
MGTRKQMLGLAAAGLAALVLAGCGQDGDSARYRVEVTNLTNAQPLTPPAAVLHRAGYSGWAEGDSASPALEELAEGGGTDAFVEAAEAEVTVAEAEAADGGVAPGDAARLILEGGAGVGLRLTVATMLAATNDGFTGISGLPLAGLARDESVSRLVAAWDAGTEANTETAGSVPALGGEGYNSNRDSAVDRITVHPGVVTADDGLAGSGLTEAHRFLGPVARITVTRVK